MTLDYLLIGGPNGISAAAGTAKPDHVCLPIRREKIASGSIAGRFANAGECPLAPRCADRSVCCSKSLEYLSRALLRGRPSLRLGNSGNCPLWLELILRMVGQFNSLKLLKRGLPPGPTTQSCANPEFPVSAEYPRFFPVWGGCNGPFAVSAGNEDRSGSGLGPFISGVRNPFPGA